MSRRSCKTLLLSGIVVMVLTAPKMAVSSHATSISHSAESESITVFGDLRDGEVLNVDCSIWNECRTSNNGSYSFNGVQAGSIESNFVNSKYTIKPSVSS